MFLFQKSLDFYRIWADGIEISGDYNHILKNLADRTKALAFIGDPINSMEDKIVNFNEELGDLEKSAKLYILFDV